MPDNDTIVMAADPARVKRLVDAMLEGFERAVHGGDDHEYNYVDVFMAGHNLHKQLVDDVARRWWEEQANASRLTYKAARDTWVQAMDQRIKDGLPDETITEAWQDQEEK